MVISAQSFSNMLIWICHTCFLKPVNTSFLGFVTNAFRSPAVFFHHSQPSDFFLRNPQLKMYLFGTNQPKAGGKNLRVSNTLPEEVFTLLKLELINPALFIAAVEWAYLSGRSAAEERVTKPDKFTEFPPLLGELLWWRKLTPTAFF